MEGVQRVQEVDEAARGRVRAGEARPRPLRAPRQGVPPRALQEGHRAAHAAQAPAGCSKDRFMDKVVFPVHSSPEFDYRAGLTWIWDVLPSFHDAWAGRKR